MESDSAEIHMVLGPACCTTGRTTGCRSSPANPDHPLLRETLPKKEKKHMETPKRCCVCVRNYWQTICYERCAAEKGNITLKSSEHLRTLPDFLRDSQRWREHSGLGNVG
jgi:hypothetical protein